MDFSDCKRKVIFSALCLVAMLQAAAAADISVVVPRYQDAPTSAFIETFTGSGKLRQAGLSAILLPDLDREVDVLLRDGKAELGLVPLERILTSDNMGRLEFSSLLAQPLIVENASRNFAVQDSVVGDIAASELEAVGLIAISPWNRMPTSLLSKQKIRNVADLAGLKVRATGQSSRKTLIALGASPQATGFAEVATALQRGAIDATEFPSQRTPLLEAVEGGTVVGNYSQPQGFLAAGERAWIGFSQAEREAIKSAAQEALEAARMVVRSELVGFQNTSAQAGATYVEAVSLEGFDAGDIIGLWMKNNSRGGADAVRMFERFGKVGERGEPAATDGGKDRSTMPRVLFATTRNDEGHGDLALRFGILRKDDEPLKCGQIDYAADPKRKFGEPHPGQYGLAGALLREPERCVDWIASQAEARGGRLVIYIHGFWNTFDTAMRRGIALAEDLDLSEPLLVWSWPSMGEASGYTYDQDSSEWSSLHFQKFVAALARKPSIKSLNIVSHSMGGRQLVRGMDALSQAGVQVDSITFVAPDVVGSIFRQGVIHFSQSARLLTLYASDWDRALMISEQKHDAPLAGQAGKSIIVMDKLDTVDASRLGKWLGVNHSYSFEIPKAVNDLRAVVSDAKPAKGRDLSALKKGALDYWEIAP